ncbi:MAG: DUF1835 domain-containing protein [Gammaproteobacteria bacterium]|nr:DUF1835 domain-containing protein [Gammaproteobacteria bacterium]MCF6259985.1 DUF1835 domain-containing protein [Gammaproteobacteria bacterium]
MSKKHMAPSDGKPPVISIPAHSAKERYRQNLLLAEQLLSAYQQGDAEAVERFKENHPEGKQAGFTPTLQDARLLITGSGVRVRRLSLEKLKKEAKTLLKALKEKQPEAVKRLLQHHPKGVSHGLNPVKLADTQCIIARENGLASWAKLKQHFVLMQQAHEHIQHPHLTLDHTLKTLHIRCGTDIQVAIQDAGFIGDFMEVNNPFPQGRVPPFDSAESFAKIRGDFIIQNYAADVPAEYADRIQYTSDEIYDIEQRLRIFPQNYERIVLWFEHDPFDQLCFAYLLAHLVDCNLEQCKIELVQVDRFPGIKKFIGIGYLSQSPENLITLWQQRTNVSFEMMAFGARCWQAFTTDDPTELWMLSQGASPLPLMQQAMLRMLKELPWTMNGLSLTEQLALEIIARDGPLDMARVFHFLNTESESMSFLGDIMFLSAMRPLWQSEVAALEVVSLNIDAPPMLRQTVQITDTGRGLMMGQYNWLAICNPEHERWVGNIRISHGRKNWHWNPDKGKPEFGY